MINCMNFFICGLPGGLDYALLAGIKWGVLSKMTEKRLNLWLQIAIRYLNLRPPLSQSAALYC